MFSQITREIYIKATILELQASIQAKANALTEKQKEKTDLEIFEQNDFIDLEDIKNEKGIWELYNENQWNK